MFRFLYRKDNNYGKVEAISQCEKTFLETANFHTIYAPKMLAIITNIIDLITHEFVLSAIILFIIHKQVY